jgi:hypothetical protein
MDAKASALRVLNVSMDAWEETDTERTGSFATETIEKVVRCETDLREHLTLIDFLDLSTPTLGIRMESRNRTVHPGAMAWVVQEMNLRGSRTRTKRHPLLQRTATTIVEATETDSRTGLGAGVKRTQKIDRWSVAMTAVLSKPMVEVTDAGTETGTEIAKVIAIDDPNGNPNGWTNQHRKNKRSILWKISRSGKRK